MVSWYSCSLVLNRDSVSSMRLPRLPSWESLERSQTEASFIMHEEMSYAAPVAMIYTLSCMILKSIYCAKGPSVQTGLTGSAASTVPSEGQVFVQVVKAMVHGML